MSPLSLPPIDATHDPALSAWVAGADAHADFPIQNLPLGVMSCQDGTARTGVAIGDWVLDLAATARAGLLPRTLAPALEAASLNAVFARPAAERLALRRRLSALLSDRSVRAVVEPLLRSAGSVEMRLPCAIGDYTDFYSGIHHARNVGRQFRPDAPLPPNYKHLPIGYHGRASSVRASGTPIVRPAGQRKPPDAQTPDFGPTRRLDYELELAIWIGPGNALGEPIPIAEAARRIAGFGLLNDWSARDMQAWEYQPLGPFLAKSFITTVSPWVITTEALAPFRIPQPPRPADDPHPLPYLWDEGDQAHGALSLELGAALSTSAMRAAGASPHQLSRAQASDLYWTPTQMLAHHTSNGCALNPGDLFGTGTISAAPAGGGGSLLELSVGGAQPVVLPNGEVRSFLEDGDEIILSARARAPGFRSLGFGDCRGRVVPAKGA